MSADTWTAADDRALAWLITHGDPDGNARPARIDPDVSQLDCWDWGIPAPPPPYVPTSVGVVVMAGMLGVLLPWAVVVAVVRWLW